MKTHTLQTQAVWRLLAVVCVMITVLSCHGQSRQLTPEEQFLKLLIRENEMIESYLEDYQGYLQYQIRTWNDKVVLSNSLILKINETFDEMPEYKKLEYQESWRRRFQPVVDMIARNTQHMIVAQTQHLQRDGMKEISKNFQTFVDIQKQQAPVPLKPQFFTEPDQVQLIP